MFKRWCFCAVPHSLAALLSLASPDEMGGVFQRNWEIPWMRNVPSLPPGSLTEPLKNDGWKLEDYFAFGKVTLQGLCETWGCRIYWCW